MKRRGLAAPLIKSAVFIVVTVLATVLLGVTIAQTESGDTVSYRARFTDASGLRAGDSVRIAGVQVGRVDGMRIVDRRLAEVTFSVERGRVLPATATAGVKWLNLVGQRYLELGQGAGQSGVLPANGLIPSERTLPAVDLTELFNGFQPLFQALSPQDVNRLADSLIQVLQGEGGTLETLLSTVGSLTTSIAAKDQVIGQVITNLNGVLETVNSRGDRFGDLISTLRALVSGLAADREPIGEAVAALGDLTESTTSLLEDGREPLRADIAELGRLSKNLERETPTVERFLDLLPRKLETIARLGSYGSWLNFYVCEATVTGVSYKQYPDETPPPLTAVAGDAARCGP
ncbi:MCE family protein [Actinocorallia aurantiaca]|uniref:MlaD family protein n=1 Tax=Actinocorallia aurantiaca TaxID=46204 RepID=A0ABN3UFF4_9ACTN